MPVENLNFTFNYGNISYLIWSPPSFLFEMKFALPLSYHIYIENQHGQLLYNDTTNNTSYKLYNLAICDIYTATVVVKVTDNGKSYTSTTMTKQGEYSGGK